MKSVILALVGVALSLPVFAQEYGEPGYPESRELFASYQQFCDDDDTYSAANDPLGDAGTWCVALENAAENTVGGGVGGIQRYLDIFPQGRYAGPARRLLNQVEQRLAREKAPQAPPAPPAPRTTGEKYYVAVATSPSDRVSVHSGEPMAHGFGWHTDSAHDAAKEAQHVCQGYSEGDLCSSGALGRSLRGGCVALALGDWQDHGEDASHSVYTAASSNHRDWAEQSAIRHCQAHITSGKSPGTVARWRCEIQGTFCSSDVQNPG